MTHIIRIDCDGTVTRLDTTDVLLEGRELFDGITTTFTCKAIYEQAAVAVGFPVFRVDLVGVCHDFAYAEFGTVNPKAWALYGRSPIAGPALLARVDHEPFDDAWLDRISTNWVTAPAMNVDAMRSIAAQHLLRWPEAVTA